MGQPLPGLLQHVLLGSQEDRGSSSCFESQTLEQNDKNRFIQDGVTQERLCSSTGGGVVGKPRSEGCLFSCTNKEISLEVPSFCSGRQDISVQGSSFRLVNLSQDFLQGVSTCDSQHQVERSAHSPLLGRYTDKGSQSTSSSGKPGDCYVPLGRSRLCYKHSQVQSNSFPGPHIHRGSTLHESGEGVSTGVKNSSTAKIGEDFQSREVLSSQSVDETIGSLSLYFSSGQTCSPIYPTNTNLFSGKVEALRVSRKGDNSVAESVPFSSVVDEQRKPGIRFGPLPRDSCACSYHRCFWGRLGRGPGRQASCTRSLESIGCSETHQLSRTSSSQSISLELQNDSERQASSYKNGQCDSLLIYKQDGRNEVPGALSDSMGDVSMVDSVEYQNQSCLSSGAGEHQGGLSLKADPVTELSPSLQSPSRSERMGVESGCATGSVSVARGSPDRSVCHRSEQEKTSILLPLSQQQRHLSGCLYNELGECVCLRLSSFGSDKQSSSEVGFGQVNTDSNCSSVAGQALVLNAASSVSPSSNKITGQTGSVESEGLVARRPYVLQTDSVEVVRDLIRSKNVPEEVVDTMLYARADGTRQVYHAQWSAFCSWCSGRDIHPINSSVNDIVLFLQHSLDKGLAVSTLKVYCAAITFYRGKVEGFSVKSHPVIATWFKGATRLRPPVKDVFPKWDLQLVLNALMEKPYEPLGEASLEALTKKTVFLLAITSAARSSELQAVDIRSELSIIRKKSASLRLNPAFLPKVLKESYINRTINLEAFYPDYDKNSRREKNWHSLCPVRALLYYVDRTKHVREDTFQMFISYANKSLGRPVCKNTIAKWIVSTIESAYRHFDRCVPQGIRAHSTRKVSTSLAALSGISIADVCRAATWSSSYVFAKHYRLDVVPQDEVSISSAVLGTATKSSLH